MQRTVLIFGSSGFIGNRLTSFLRSEECNVITAPSLRGTKTLEEARAKLSVLPWACVNEVYNCSGLAHEHNLSEREFGLANAEIPLLITEFASRHGVSFVLHLGSVSAWHNSEISYIDDNSRFLPDTSYGRSKLRLVKEHYLMFGGLQDTRWVILCPPMVYGFGAKGNPKRLERFLLKGWPVICPPRSVKRSMISIEELLTKIALCAGCHLFSSGSYLVAEEEPRSILWFVKAMRQEINSTSPIIVIPHYLVLFLLRIAALISKTPLACRPTRDITRLFAPLVINTINWHREVRKCEAFSLPSNKAV